MNSAFFWLPITLTALALVLGGLLILFEVGHWLGLAPFMAGAGLLLAASR